MLFPKKKNDRSMNIVIAGAGAVGTHLAYLLSRESHNIILVDQDADRLEEPSSRFDIMTINVSATSIVGLKAAQAGSADLVIAVTSDESRNLAICMLAHNMGAKKTVARVDNAEYLESKYKRFFVEMGIDSLIYPEHLAAQEIANSLNMSWVRQSWEFHGGALELIGVKVRSDAQILDQKLKDMGAESLPFHVVGIKRKDEMLIPRGEDMLRAGDIVYFMTDKKSLPRIRTLCGKDNYSDVKNVIIIGGGKIAVQSARLIPPEMKVKIVEIDEERCKKLSAEVDPRIMTINGDGRDMNLLVDEDIKSTQAFIALTGNTETNILACLAAKRMGVRKTVALIENLDYASMAESLDIGTIVNKKAIAAGHIYQMMLDADVSNLKCLTVSTADVVEFVAKEGSLATKMTIRELSLPKGATIGGLVRVTPSGTHEGILVSGSTRIQEGDSVVVFCVDMDVKNLEKYFRGKNRNHETDDNLDRVVTSGIGRSDIQESDQDA